MIGRINMNAHFIYIYIYILFSKCKIIHSLLMPFFVHICKIKSALEYTRKENHLFHIIEKTGNRDDLYLDLSPVD